METKKSEQADLRKNITLYVLTGLAFMTLISWQALEYESREVEEVEEVFVVEESEVEEEIPITQLLDTPPPPPPPPPAPEIIEVVENDVEIEDVIIEDTETDIEEEIVEVEDVDTEYVAEEVIADVPFAIIENVPVYPGCEDMKNNDDRMKCLNEKIKRFVNKNFNTRLANKYDLDGRQTIRVQFKIDSKGNITGIRSAAKIKGNDVAAKGLEAEAARVINKLPKMIPGKQRGKAVNVIYALPIVFDVQ